MKSVEFTFYYTFCYNSGINKTYTIWIVKHCPKLPRELWNLILGHTQSFSREVPVQPDTLALL